MTSRFLLWTVPAEMSNLATVAASRQAQRAQGGKHHYPKEEKKGSTTQYEREKVVVLSLLSFGGAAVPSI